jgi:hypothetical protein
LVVNRVFSARSFLPKKGLLALDFTLSSDLLLRSFYGALSKTGRGDRQLVITEKGGQKIKHLLILLKQGLEVASELTDSQFVAKMPFGNVVVALINVSGGLSPDHLVEADDQALVETRLQTFYSSVGWGHLPASYG